MQAARFFSASGDKVVQFFSALSDAVLQFFNASSDAILQFFNVLGDIALQSLAAPFAAKADTAVITVTAAALSATAIMRFNVLRFIVVNPPVNVMEKSVIELIPFVIYAGFVRHDCIILAELT